MNLSKKATVLWAKKRSEDGAQYYLPLVVHLTDASNTINWLFNHWISDSQKRFLTQFHSEEEIQKLVKFIGFTHDIGKATPAFQTKPAYGRGDETLDHELIEKLTRSSFAKLNELDLALAKKSPHALAGEAILENFEVPETVAAIIGGHHGKPLSQAPRHQIRDYTANYLQKDHDEVLQAPWRSVQKELFNYGLQTAGYQTVKDIPEVEQPVAVILEGLLIMADWLSSSEYLNDDQQVPLFPLISLEESWEDIDTTERFRQAMTSWYLGGEWDPQPVTDVDPYKTRWGFNARPVQAAITKAIGKTNDPGMVIIEAPMGLGKTESALVAVEQLAAITGSDGVFMGLPTQATTNAMFDRVTTWLGLLAKSQGANFPIKLMQGKAQFKKTYRDLPNAMNVDEFEGDPGSVVVNTWFSGKKSILTKFAVGTIDNLLLMGLKQKHLFLRHLGFSGKVVVIDEVHAYDAYMNNYLYKAVNWLGAYHVPMVILSATLPKDKRNKLLKAYLKGKYGKKYKKELQAKAGWEQTQAYPLLSLLDGPEIKQVSDFEGVSGQPPVQLQVQRLSVDDEQLIQAVVNKISAGGIAGIIVNTVKRAQKLASLVPADIKLMVLHSAFLAPDRVKQETQLQAAIGKNGQRPEKMIVIGTQVLEQSLDIDFDVLYTDIAPMDLILQRAGRLHRHHIERPEALKRPQLFITGIEGPGDYGTANETIYEKYLLLKTDHYLTDSINIPDDISTLVQAVYDEKTDDQVPELMTAQAKFKDDLRQERNKSEVYQIGDPNAEKTIHGWLDRDQGNIAQDEIKASAAVRDIQETLEVILVQRTKTGDQLLNGQALSQVTSQEIAEQVIRIPAAITPVFEIEKVIKQLETITGKNFPDWQQSVWLRGALVLLLDENATGTLGKWQLKYSPELGLSYSKEDDHG